MRELGHQQSSELFMLWTHYRWLHRIIVVIFRFERIIFDDSPTNFRTEWMYVPEIRFYCRLQYKTKEISDVKHSIFFYIHASLICRKPIFPDAALPYTAKWFAAYCISRPNVSGTECGVNDMNGRFFIFQSSTMLAAGSLVIMTFERKTYTSLYS